MTEVVFLGPSLEREEARALLPGALLLPPARQGDVFRAVRDHAATAVGLVDGAFLDVPAVWHREILWAMGRGVAVAGAASMGALRAAELWTLGMQGVGQVFAAYRDGVLPGWDGAFEDDDEVAVVHAPAELGFRALSWAMVDVRATLARAEAEGVIGRGERDALAGRMKSLHFPHRRKEVLAGMAAPGLRAWLERGGASVKAEDARELLRVLPGCRAGAAVAMERVLTWERFVAGAQEAGRGEGGEEEERVLAALEADGEAWRAVAREAAARLAGLEGSCGDGAGGDAGEEEAGHGEAGYGEAGHGDARAALDRFRRERGLLLRRDLDGWMAANGLDAAGLVRLLERQGRLDGAAGRAGAAALREAMLDVLRLSGRYARLRGGA